MDLLKRARALTERVEAEATKAKAPVQSTRVPIGAHCDSTAEEQKLGDAQNELNGISL